MSKKYRFQTETHRKLIAGESIPAYRPERAQQSFDLPDQEFAEQVSRLREMLQDKFCPHCGEKL